MGSDLAEDPDWSPEFGNADKPNVLSASISQDRERGWTSSDIPEIRITEEEERFGKLKKDVGTLAFVNDVLDAQRLLPILLDRDKSGLTKVTLIARAFKNGAISNVAKLVPGDIIALGNDLAKPGTYRVVGIEHRLGVRNTAAPVTLTCLNWISNALPRTGSCVGMVPGSPNIADGTANSFAL